MSNFKKVLASTAAAIGLISLAAPANANVTINAARDYVSGTANAARTFRTSADILVDATGYAGIFTIGNQITFTLSQGTFVTTPTVAAAGGGTATYVAGGAGTNSITVQIGGTVTGLTLASAQSIINNVTSTTDGSLVNIVLSDSGGVLAPLAATAKTAPFATFNEAYTVALVPGGTPEVDLNSPSLGSRFTGGNVANLGTVRITPKALPLYNWAAVALATPNTQTLLTSPVANNNTFSITIPSGAFGTGSSVDFGGSCVTGAPVNITTIAAGVVTLPGTALNGVNPPNGLACDITVNLNGPTTGTTLLSAGATTSATTIALGGALNVTPNTRSSTTTLNTITYNGGAAPKSLGYVVGADANYDFYVSVQNSANAGPVIVQATVDGATGTAVVAPTLAANSNGIYSIAQIRSALVAVGMPSTVFASAGSRGTLEVVVPTGAKVAPLLLNKVNGQVVNVDGK